MKYKSALCEEFWEYGKASDCPIYDMHAHMGGFFGFYLPGCTPDQMVKSMDRAGINIIAFSHNSSISSPDFYNKENISGAGLYPERFKAYCVINPNYPELIDNELKMFESRRDIFIGFKLHPTSHNVPLNDRRYERIWEYIDEKGLPVLVHTWGRNPLNDDKMVNEVVRKYKNALIILGHSLNDKWDEAVEITGKFPNVYLELSTVFENRAGILEKFVEKAGSEKLLFGTDFPLYNHHYIIGGVLAADITDEDRRNIFYRNAQRILPQLR